MSPAHKRFLLLEEAVGSVIVNLIINSAIAFLMFRGASQVPLWGQQSIAGDTVGTTFFLPLFTTLIVTPLARKNVQAGRFEALEWARDVPPALQWLPQGTFARGLVLGFLCMVIVAPLSVGALSALGMTEQSFWSFVTFKALFAAALGAPVTPLIALLAIAKR
jgi:hypothetical protein